MRHLHRRGRDDFAPNQPDQPPRARRRCIVHWWLQGKKRALYQTKDQTTAGALDFCEAKIPGRSQADVLSSVSAAWGENIVIPPVNHGKNSKSTFSRFFFSPFSVSVATISRITGCHSVISFR